MPLVSVVLPTHNRSVRLQKAAASASAQTEEDLEIVIVDDASSDETPEVVDRLAGRDARVKVIRLAGGRGAAAARNAGIRASTGRFLAFLDDDDEWSPVKLRSQLDYLDANRDAALVSCDFWMVGRGRSVLHSGPERFPRSTLMWANVLMGCSFVTIDRSRLSFEPSFDESLTTAEDWDLWFRCSEERAAAVLPAPLALYARHGVQLSGNAERVNRGEQGFVDKHEARLSAHARAFHRAHLLVLGAHGEIGRMRARLGVLRGSHPAVARVITRLAWSRRLGRLLDDPGRPLRTLAHEVARLER